MKPLTLLGYALLGLLHEKMASGYDLRKTFTNTPMGSFSDSPGAIYPALKRLEERKLIDAISKAHALRDRRTLKLRPEGLTELMRWLSSPIDRSDIANRMNALMLRFAFIDQVLGGADTLVFLESFKRELIAYIPSLRKYLVAHSGHITSSARLALESGIYGYEAQAKWVERALKVYRSKVNSR